jgi:hypothetical protein
MKTYTIAKKKQQKKQKRMKTKTSNEFLSLKMRFFYLEKAVMALAVNPVDLIIRFSWLRRTSKSEFSIKSYGRLKLRWSDFDFYFYRLYSLFRLSLSSLFLYMKTDEKGLVSRGISIFKFLFLEHWIGINEREMGNPWEQMLLVGAKK